MKTAERERKQALERKRQIEEHRAEFLRRKAAGLNSALPQFKMTKLVAEQLAYENKLDRQKQRTA
jgi:hypothetical protein